MEPVSSHPFPLPSPSPFSVFAKLHWRFSPKLRTGFLRVGLTSFHQEKLVCKLKAGPESAKMGTEGGVTSVVQQPQSWAWIVPRGDVVEIAASQLDIHILWEQLAWEGFRTLQDGERE